MIPIKLFGNTGHKSSRTIFGGASLWSVSQDEADKALELLLKYGINHIDTAASYGDSEIRIAPWMREYRNRFFLATKTEKRTHKEAIEDLYKSLERLKVDHIDLWQMHNLVNPGQRELALIEGGAIDAFIQAKEDGLVNHLGITGHGLSAPVTHLNSFNKYKFDSVLLPYNYILLQDKLYSQNFLNLEKYCVENKVAIQTIKSISKGSLGSKKSKYAVWYDPLENDEAIEHAVQWVLGNENIFLNTVGDLDLLPKVLAAAENFIGQPSNEIMNTDLRKYDIKPLFTGPEI